MVDRLTVKINLNDVEDSAADYDVGDNCEPGRRFGFGHPHAESEEI